MKIVCLEKSRGHGMTQNDLEHYTPMVPVYVLLATMLILYIFFLNLNFNIPQSIFSVACHREQL